MKLGLISASVPRGTGDFSERAEKYAALIQLSRLAQQWGNIGKILRCSRKYDLPLRDSKGARVRRNFNPVAIAVGNPRRNHEEIERRPYDCQRAVRPAKIFSKSYPRKSKWGQKNSCDEPTPNSAPWWTRDTCVVHQPACEENEK